MEFHPFADIWPLLNDAELAVLAADIKANGQRLPIIVYQRKILDGRNRFLACGKAGVPPRCEDAKAKNDQEALLLVVSMNEHRRHASVEQRAFAAEQIATLKKGRPRDQTEINVSKEILTIPEAAKLMGISKPCVDRARVIRTHAPELEKEVLNGKIALTTAAAKAHDKARAKKPARKPLKSVAEIYDARAAMFAKHPPKSREEIDPDFKGTPLDWIDKHGHVQIYTEAEKQTSKRKKNRMDWTKAISDMAEIAKKLMELPDVDAVTWNETDARLRQRFAENLAVIDQMMERVHASGLKSAPNGKGRQHREQTMADETKGHAS